MCLQNLIPNIEFCQLSLTGTSLSQNVLSRPPMSGIEPVAGLVAVDVRSCGGEHWLGGTQKYTWVKEREMVAWCDVLDGIRRQ